MSGDGPTKLVPDVEPLDDIILGEDDDTLNAPRSHRTPSHSAALRPSPTSPPPKQPSTPPPPEERRSSPRRDRISNRWKSASEVEDLPKDLQNVNDAKKRAKLTLRIPDDEVARPTLATPSRPPSSAPDEEPPRRTPAPTPLMGTPIVSIGSADDTLELTSDELRAHLAALSADSAPTSRSSPATGIDPSDERGWTPYQPPVEPSAAARHEDGERRAIHPRAPVARNGGGTLLDHHEVHNSSPPPMSDEIPIDLEAPTSVPDPASEEMMTYPRLPRALDSEEIKIEDSDDGDDGERVSDPADAPEVEPEDLVSVESLPTPGRPPPPTKTAGKYPAFKAPDSTPTATALMAAAPTGTSSRPAMAAVQVATPAPTPAPIPAPSAPAAIAPVSTGSPLAARRSNGPQFFVPPVGALAPPPMTDTMAVRKKTRPWWEELFNDDFIRTMAKVTDAQILGEVNFIEESLGCEAGAMILDLACGTGRHAVELATRGYQVVGFDLSLAMLARASDEAQDRKQKINFVQGDMREMTFEETFDGVYAWNTSFGYFDEEKNAAVVSRVHKALKKGGQFLLDVVNRDYIVRQAPSLAWFEGDGCICMDEMTIDFITSRMRVKRTLMMDDGRTKEIEYSIRVYSLHELGKLLHDSGFRVAEVSGRTGTPGVFFGCESPRTLILAEKR